MRRQQHVGSNKNNLPGSHIALGATTMYSPYFWLARTITSNLNYSNKKNITYDPEQPPQESANIPFYTLPSSTPTAWDRTLSFLGSPNYLKSILSTEQVSPFLQSLYIPKPLNARQLLLDSSASAPKPQQQVLTLPNSSELSVDSTVTTHTGTNQNFDASTPTTVHPKDLNVNYTPAINNVIPKTAQKQVISTASQDNEKAEREAREKAEREAREKAGREAREKAEREAREKDEREAREKAEREAREKAEREAGENEEEKKEELQSQTNSIDAPGSTTLTTVNTSAAGNSQEYLELNKIDKKSDTPAKEIKQEEPEIPVQEVNQGQKEINSEGQDKTGSENDGNQKQESLLIESEDPAPSNEQVDNVIKELPQDQIAQIVEKAKTLELKVLGNLKTLYTELKEELKNPPQKSDNSYLNKRLLIIKNIDNILKDIEKSEKNIGLGISVNRHKALVSENRFKHKRNLDSINTDRQRRSEELKILRDLPDIPQINYSELELGKIEKFVQKSGKDLKQVANTRNDDIRRKFFSSFIDHTISFAKYNVNWAPAAYNLLWAVGEYVVMGIVVDTIKQGAHSIKNSYGIGTGISNWIKAAPDKDDKAKTANLFTRSIATLSGIIGGWAAMTIMTPIILVFTGGKDVLYTPVGIYKNYQSYKKDKDGSTKNWAKSRAILKSERTTRKNEAHTTKEQKKFAETVKSQTTYEPKKR